MRSDCISSCSLLIYLLFMYGLQSAMFFVLQLNKNMKNMRNLKTSGLLLQVIRQIATRSYLLMNSRFLFLTINSLSA